VDTLPILVQRPQWNQDGYCSGKYKTSYAKMQVHVTAAGNYMDATSINYGSSHAKATFDDS
jgi:hypothetical protein